MDSDGQLQLADICLTHFSYNRLTFSDDSGEHKLELGTFRVQNLLPNTSSIYQVRGWGEQGESLGANEMRALGRVGGQMR